MFFARAWGTGWRMTSAEARALERAALLVLSLCVVRSVASHWGPRGPTPYEAATSETGRLLAESSERRSEEARHKRPLSPDERLDPNTAPEEELDRLPGVGPATAKRIVRLREERGAFSGVDDLLAVPGIGPATLARMAPHRKWRGASRGRARPLAGPRHRGRGGPSLTDSVVDLNRASRQELERLPGVGPTIAQRILALRDSLGGFRTPDDLERVRGIGPATVARLKPLVSAGG